MDSKLPALCLANMKQLIQSAAQNSSVQFEKSPERICSQIAGGMVTTHLDSCFGYDITNFHLRHEGFFLFYKVSILH